MDKNPSEISDIESFSQKQSYSAEEKKLIMDRLNEERLERQRAEDAFLSNKKTYSEEEKKQILNKLNEKRLSKQKVEEIKKKRTYKKKIYKFENKEFYKFMNMQREYFIEIKDCEKFSSRPAIFTLYYRSIDELKKKDVLMKTEIYSDKFFISHDPVRVYFKQYSLEDER